MLTFTGGAPFTIHCSTMKYAEDPIPIDAIRLSNGFNRVFCFLEANPRLVETPVGLRAIRLDYWIGILGWNQARDRLDPKLTPNDLELWHFDRVANILVRESLQAQRLSAYVRDPKNGDILRLRPFNWIPDHWAVSGDNIVIEGVGISDFVRSDYASVPASLDFVPGPPGSFRHGASRPVFFLRDEFEKWFSAIFGDKKEKGGRPRGSGSMEHHDEPYVNRMRQLIVSKEAKSPHDAASIVARSVKDRKGAAEDSIVRRLRDRYLKQFPERN